MLVSFELLWVESPPVIGTQVKKGNECSLGFEPGLALTSRCSYAYEASGALHHHGFESRSGLNFFRL